MQYSGYVLIFNMAAVKAYRGELLVVYLRMYACVCSYGSSSIGITCVPLDGTGTFGTTCSCVSPKGMMCTSLSCVKVTLGTAAGISCLLTLGTGIVLLGSGGTVVVCCIGVGVSLVHHFCVFCLLILGKYLPICEVLLPAHPVYPSTVRRI